MAVLFTSDLHLGHANILTARGFQDIDEHDNMLIDKWNAKVSMIVGNNDHFWMHHVEDMYAYFETVDYLKTMKFEKKQVTLCHYPMLEWPGSRYVESENSFLLHGHIHATTEPKVYGHIKDYLPHALNCGVDINGFEPVTFEELKRNNALWYGRKEV